MVRFCLVGDKLVPVDIAERAARDASADEGKGASSPAHEAPPSHRGRNLYVEDEAEDARFARNAWKLRDREIPKPPIHVTAQDFAGKASPTLVMGTNGGQVTDLERSPIDLAKTICPPPTAAQLEKLGKRAEPTLIIARMVSDAGEDRTQAPYAVLLPPHFDPKRSEAYTIVNAIPPKGTKLEEAARAVASALPTRANTVVVIPDMTEKPGDQLAAGRAAIEGHVLDWLQNDYGIDFRSYATLPLRGASTSWSQQIATSQATPTRMDTVTVWNGKDWQTLPPTRNWRRQFEDTDVPTTRLPPEALKRQADDRGFFFSPVSKTGSYGSGKRFGVYLPPGYDPAATTTYPILVLMPGVNNPLSHWTTAGQLVPHLDHMMQGDAQKMIVVVQGGSSSGPEPEALVAIAAKHFHGDPARISVSGISMGASNAGDFLRKAGSAVRSLGLHAGVMMRGIPTDIPVYVDVGADEDWRKKDSIGLAAKLEAAGGDVTLHVAASKERKLGHSWACWEPLLESWIAFHQRAHGKPGEARLDADVTDASAKMKQEAKAEAARDAEREAERRNRKGLIESFFDWF